MTKAKEGPDAGWLLLIYRIPSEPTRLRSTVWRRLKGSGAIYLQNSAAALPASTSAERALRRLRHEIVEMSGSAVLLSCSVLQGEAEVRAAFEAARNDEYEEIVDKCQDFLAGVEKEFAAEHFSFAELEENEVDHAKLVNWLAKVQEPDRVSRPAEGPATHVVKPTKRSSAIRRSVPRTLRSRSVGGPRRAACPRVPGRS